MCVYQLICLVVIKMNLSKSVTMLSQSKACFPAVS